MFKTHRNPIHLFIIFLGLFLSVLCIFSLPATAQNSDLEYFLPNATIANVTIAFSTNKDAAEQDNIEIPVIKHESRQAIVKGVVVLIADIQPQGYGDQTLMLLSQRLPDWGWNTLLVTPKPEYFAQLSNNESAENNTESSSNDSQAEEAQPDKQDDKIKNQQQLHIKSNQLQAPELPYTAKQYSEFTRKLLTALQDKFMRSPGYQVVFVRGKSASSMLSVLNQNSNSGINALVMNNPYWPHPSVNQAVASNVANTSIPVLDLLNYSDNNWAKKTSHQRLIETRIALKSLYRQRQLIGVTANEQQAEYIAKEMIGFLTYLGW